MLFKKRVDPVLSEGSIPSGVCVSVDNKDFYYINGSYRHLIPTKRIRDSWSFPFVISVDAAILANYRKAKPLGFRDGTLVRSLSSGKTYLISSRQKRPVGNPDLLLAAGVTRIGFASDKELALHADGEVIN